MVYKSEQKSQLQPLHHYISCHRSKPLSLQHLLCCWQLQSSNISSCSDTISISSEVHSLSEGHETWCLCFTTQRLTGGTLQGDQHMPVTAEWAMAMSITISSRQLQSEPCFFVGLEKSNKWAILIHVYSTAIRNMHLISRHLQSSQGAGYWETPKKLTGSLSAQHLRSLSLRTGILPFTSIIAPLEPRIMKAEMWSRSTTLPFLLQGQQGLSLPDTVVVANVQKASLKEIQ